MNDATILVKNPDIQTSWCLTRRRLAQVNGMSIMLMEKSQYGSETDSINFDPIGVRGFPLQSGFEIPVEAAVKMAWEILRLAKQQAVVIQNEFDVDVFPNDNIIYCDMGDLINDTCPNCGNPNVEEDQVCPECCVDWTSPLPKLVGELRRSSDQYSMHHPQPKDLP